MNLEGLSSIPAKAQEWVWKWVIPAGQLTLLTGEPNVGKSMFAMEAIARVTKGQCGLAYDDKCERGEVILFSGEDNFASVVRNRLEAAGAEIPLVSVSGKETDSTLAKPGFARCRLDDDRQLESLEEHLNLLRGTGDPCRLIVIDPVHCFLDATDGRDDAKIRETMTKLAELADRSGAAILLIASPSPVEKRKRGGWSKTTPVLAEMARSVWTIVCDPDEPERRVLLPVKTNLCETPPGIGFTIENQRICWEDEWVRQTAKQYVADVYEKERLQHVAAQSELSRATEWLKNRLGDRSVYTYDLMADAAKNDISEATLRRALVLSGCRKGKERTSDGRWFWRLPTPLTLPVHTSRPELRPETLDFNVAGGELWSS